MPRLSNIVVDSTFSFFLSSIVKEFWCILACPNRKLSIVTFPLSLKIGTCEESKVWNSLMVRDPSCSKLL